MENSTPTKMQIAFGCVLGGLVGNAIGHQQEQAKQIASSHQAECPYELSASGHMLVALCKAISANIYNVASDRLAHLTAASAWRYHNWYEEISQAAQLSTWWDDGWQQGTQGKPPPEWAHLVLGSSNANPQDVKHNASLFNDQLFECSCLVRAAPLGIHANRFSLEETVQMAINDALLTHPNPNCVWSCVALVVAVRHLFLNPLDSAGAICAAQGLLRTPAASVVRLWLDKAVSSGNQTLARCLRPDKSPLDELEITFTHAFHSLANRISFMEGISRALEFGSNSTAIASVTGALLGTLWGIKGIPEQNTKALLEIRSAGALGAFRISLTPDSARSAIKACVLTPLDKWIRHVD